ncbi:MAG: CPBP family intramembrane metalloprotease [Candidatus Lokiarchaeota archaeon]|nr:CPBP family intramembrane metalloprotease [Candidatus Lokiarchaeota archaeon]
MTELNDEGYRTLSELDKLILQASTVIITCLSVLYFVYFNDLFIAIYGIGSFLLAIFIIGEDPPSPIRKDSVIEDPLVESAIVLLVFLDWTLLVAPSFNLANIAIVTGSLIFAFAIPLLFMVVFRENKISSLGFNLSDIEKSSPLTVSILVSLIIGFIIRLLLGQNSLEFFGSQDIHRELLSGIITMAVIPALIEEFIFRGIMQDRLSYRMRSRVGGIVTTTMVFAALHLFTVASGFELYQGGLAYPLLHALLTRLPLGLILGMIWDKSRSLIPVFLIHFTNNAVYLILQTAATV